ENYNFDTHNAKSKYTNLGLNRNLGQFFSPKILVDKCISLIKNKNGRILEPSCGDLAFKKCLNENAVFIKGVSTKSKKIIIF
ncbi:MAG: hypothetical protein SOW07_01750, partial [Helicobacter sp.]|nr:hypothetical protein [Helicobacter sp.]